MCAARACALRRLLSLLALIRAPLCCCSADGFAMAQGHFQSIRSYVYLQTLQVGGRLRPPAACAVQSCTAQLPALPIAVATSSRLPSPHSPVVCLCVQPLQFDAVGGVSAEANNEAVRRRRPWALLSGRVHALLPGASASAPDRRRAAASLAAPPARRWPHWRGWRPGTSCWQSGKTWLAARAITWPSTEPTSWWCCRSGGRACACGPEGTC
jgi:hypothetical protein